MANLPKGGGRGIPIQGGGKGKPGAGPASGPGTEPDAGAEVLVPAAVVVAVPLGRETAGKTQKEVSLQVSTSDFAALSYLGMQKAHLRWWMEGLQPLLSLEEVGQVERDPLGATVGTCLEEKEAGGPGGLQR